MRHFLLLLFFASMYSLSSCKKESINNTSPAIKDTPVLLTSMYVLDTTYSSPADTMAKYFFEYDAQFRISEMRFEDWMNGGQPIYSIITRPVYNGNDSLPASILYKTTSYPGGVMQITYDTTDITYLGSLRVKDSAHGEGSRYVRTYAYSGNQINITENYPQNPSSSRKSFHTMQYSNGNLIRQIDSIISISTSSVITSKYNYQFQFNNQPDPLFKALRHLCKPIFDEDGWTHYGFQRFVSPNSMTQLYYDYEWVSVGGTGGSGGDYNQLNYSYQFRPDGFPLVQNQTQNLATATFNFKQLYYYNK